MGQYFRPFNLETKEVVQGMSFTENGGLTWIRNIYRYEQEEMGAINKVVASAQGWDVNLVGWIGDYGDVVVAEATTSREAECDDEVRLKAWPDDE